MEIKRICKIVPSGIFFLLLLLFHSRFTRAQDDSMYNTNDKHTAYSLACHLRSGALLVCLKTRAKTIEQLKLKGDLKLADQIRQKQLEENKFIMSCFKQQFDFCPVYFFYNTSNDSIQQGKVQHILLDSNLVVNPSIQFNGDFFLIAEEGDIEITNQLENNNTPASTSKVSYTIRSGGIRVMNSEFQLLESPFPYFTDYGRYKNLDKAVAKLNRKLKDLCPNKTEK